MFRRLFLAILILLPATLSAGQPALDVVTSDYPPYEYQQGDQVVGSDTLVIRNVLNEMGYQANIRILPWARAEKQARSGKADMLYSLTFSEARDQHYFFTDPISTAQDVFFKLRDRDLTWETLDDLQGLNFGLSASYSYAPAFMDWLFSGNARTTRITQDKPELTGLRLVALGRIDLFICEQSVCQYLLEKHAAEFPELDKVARMPGNVGPKRSFRAGFSRQLPNGSQLRDEFNDALDTLYSADSQ